VPFVSKAFKANGQFNFSYEINMLNTHKAPFQLLEIQIFSTQLTSYPDAAFDSLFLGTQLLSNFDHAIIRRHELPIGNGVIKIE